MIDRWGEREGKKKKNLIKRGRYREKSVGREEGRGGDGVRREKKQREEKKWESLLWEGLNERKKILFPESEEYNMYRS